MLVISILPRVESMIVKAHFLEIHLSKTSTAGDIVLIPYTEKPKSVFHKVPWQPCVKNHITVDAQETP